MANRQNNRNIAVKKVNFEYSKRNVEEVNIKDLIKRWKEKNIGTERNNSEVKPSQTR